MENVKKNPIKKIGKIALCSAIALGSVAGMLGNSIVNDTQVVSAVAISTNVSQYGNNFDMQLPLYIYKASCKLSGVDIAHPLNYSITLDRTISSRVELINDIQFTNYRNENTFGFGMSMMDFDSVQYYVSNVKINETTILEKDLSTIFTGFSLDYANSSIVIGSLPMDVVSPALETQVFLTDVDSPMTLEYILSQVKFVDEVDGDIEEVVVSDNYSSNMNKVGKWTIEVKATDNSGNTGYGTIEVWVQDKTSPIITGQATYTSNMSSPITREYIESQLSVSDNVDENVGLTLVSDGFTGNENIVGKKTIVYRATDSVGNTSLDYTITINCVDDIKPTITGESNYTTSYKVALDIETLKSALTLNDNISTDLTLEEVSDNYTGNESIPGTYNIKYRTTDGAGNISDVFTITIVVNDKIPPIFYTSGLFIGISKANTLSHDEIVEILLNMNGVENSNMGVALLSLGGYELDGFNQPMSYSISYRLTDENGIATGEVLNATINVLGEEEIKENDEKTQVEQRVKNLWQKIGDFFENLWNWIVKYLGFGWLWDKEGKYNPNW